MSGGAADRLFAGTSFQNYRRECMKIGEMMQTADWKNEKHVPVIDCPETVKAGENFNINVTVGKEIPHPNKTDHHIQWISLFFKPDDDQYAAHLGDYVFDAHGASTKGPDTGSAYTEPHVTTMVKLQKSGTLLASSHCNIHGLWEYSKAIKVQ